jgi:hypothetical protein
MIFFCLFCTSKLPHKAMYILIPILAIGLLAFGTYLLLNVMDVKVRLNFNKK